MVYPRRWCPIDEAAAIQRSAHITYVGYVDTETTSVAKQTPCVSLKPDVWVRRSFCNRPRGEPDVHAHLWLLTFYRPCFPFCCGHPTSRVFFSVSTTIYSVRYEVTPNIVFLGLGVVFSLLMGGWASTVRQAYRQTCTCAKHIIYPSCLLSTLNVAPLSFFNSSAEYCYG